jgi:hypothetical protein
MRIFSLFVLVGLALVTPPAAAEIPSKGSAFFIGRNSETRAGSKFSSTAVNRALQADPQNVRLNFLNGLIYDAGSTPGDGRELARVGYEIAVRNDSTYWPAAYQLGLLAMDNRDPLTAERWLLMALSNAPREPEVAYALARAAYCAGDYDTAAAALSRARSLASESRNDHFLTAALVSASTGDNAATSLWLKRLKPTTDSVRFDQVEARTRRLLHHAQFSPSTEARPAGPPAPVHVGVPIGLEPKTRTAVIDLIFLRRDVGMSNGRGVNLLDMLKLNFGSSLLNSISDKIKDQSLALTTSNTDSISRSVSVDIPTVTYSLNVANASGGNSSIEGHPSILVYDGQSSSLFSGNTVTYGVSGNSGGSTFTKDVGLQLSVKPIFRDNGPVNLTVTATLETFVTGGTTSFKEQITTQKDSANVVADLNFDQAILVSTGTLQKSSSNASQVPVVGSIPGLNLLFRRSDKIEQRTDLYVLMSLRKVDDSRIEMREKLRLEIERLLYQDGFLDRSKDIDKQVEIAGTTELHMDFYRMENPGRDMNEPYLHKLGFFPSDSGYSLISK